MVKRKGLQPRRPLVWVSASLGGTLTFTGCFLSARCWPGAEKSEGCLTCSCQPKGPLAMEGGTPQRQKGKTGQGNFCTQKSVSMRQEYRGKERLRSSSSTLRCAQQQSLGLQGTHTRSHRKSGAAGEGPGVRILGPSGQVPRQRQSGWSSAWGGKKGNGRQEEESGLSV